MDAVTVPQPISPVKYFLAKSQKLLIDVKRVYATSVKHLKLSIPQRTQFSPMCQKEERKILIAL